MRKAALNAVYALAKKDPRIVYIGSDPGAGTLSAMQADCPERFFIEGISEGHIAGMAAGMAMEGLIPYVNTIATFLTRRCLEQVAVDICLHRLPVRLIANGGGLVYAPLGPTHCAIEDIALMRALPNMTVVCPADAGEMSRFMQASLEWPDPIYIRLAKGGDPIVTPEGSPFEIGKAVRLKEGQDVLFVTTGIMAGRALDAAAVLNQESIQAGVLHLPTVKPLDAEALHDAVVKAKAVITVEEHVRNGGLGSAVLEALADAGLPLKNLQRLALPDKFLHNYGSQDGLLRRSGLDAASLAQAARSLLQG